MNDIQIFNNPQFGDIRTAIGENNEPLFCLADVCKAVGLTNPSSVKSRLDKSDIQVIDLHALNPTEGITGNSKANFITENGFYDVLLYSDAPQVKPFRKWVTSDVLPSIRKHGMYATPITIDRMLADPDFAIQLLTNYKEERQRRLEAEKEIMELSDKVEVMRPKAEYYDSILASPDSLVVTQIAKDYGMSPQEFNKRLCSLGIQYKVNGQWVLYAKYQGEGYTDSTTGRKRNSGGSWMLTVWTQKGRLFLYTMLKEANVLPVIERYKGYCLPPIRVEADNGAQVEYYR